MRFYYRFEFDRQIFFRNQVSVEKETKKQRPLSTPISSAGALLRAQYDNISALQLCTTSGKPSTWFPLGGLAD